MFATPSVSVRTPLMPRARFSRPVAAMLAPSCAPEGRVLDGRLPAESIMAAFTESSSLSTSTPTERAQTIGSAVAE